MQDLISEGIARLAGGIAKAHWDTLSGVERFYLKMIELEARGTTTLDNYPNFAKAFKVRDFRALMGDQRANQARLKSAVEFGRAEMATARSSISRSCAPCSTPSWSS